MAESERAAPPGGARVALAERRLLETLDRALRREGVAQAIEPIVRRVLAGLARDPGAVMAWEPVPLALYGATLPEAILSSWVFILRAGATTGAERHPNSHQRVVAWRESGDLQTFEAGRWRSHLLSDDPRRPLLERWATIPPNVWHQVVVPGRHFTVVSFHTAPERELIEERPARGEALEALPDPDRPAATLRRLYLEPGR